MTSNESADPGPKDPVGRRFRLDRAKAILTRTIPERTGALVGSSRRRASFLLKPERPETVFEEASFFQPFPDAPVENEFLNVLWRSEALLALSAILGQLAEDQLIHRSRELFHDRLSHQELSQKLFGHDYAALHRWMDMFRALGRARKRRSRHTDVFGTCQENVDRPAQEDDGDTAW
jgi:hypothetical protein